MFNLSRVLSFFSSFLKKLYRKLKNKSSENNRMRECIDQYKKWKRQDDKKAYCFIRLVEENTELYYFFEDIAHQLEDAEDLRNQEMEEKLPADQCEERELTDTQKRYNAQYDDIINRVKLVEEELYGDGGLGDGIYDVDDAIKRMEKHNAEIKEGISAWLVDAHGLIDKSHSDLDKLYKMVGLNKLNLIYPLKSKDIVKKESFERKIELNEIQQNSNSDEKSITNDIL